MSERNADVCRCGHQRIEHFEPFIAVDDVTVLEPCRIDDCECGQARYR